MKAIKPLCGILTITAVLALQVHAQNWLTNGLVAYYPFNGNANDESGNGHDGVVTSSAGIHYVADRFDLGDSAVAFSAQGGYIKLPGLDAAVPTTSQFMTVSFWAKSITTGCVISKYLQGFPEQCNFAVSLSSSHQIQAIDNRLDSVIPSYSAENKWVHYVFVFRNGAINTEMYKNGGQLLGSGMVQYNTVVANTALVIGKVFGSPEDGLDGAIDDLRIYNRALSSNEVAHLYACDSTGFVPPRTATANAVVVSGFVVGAAITDGGCGYTNAPIVKIIGGSGSGAQAVAVVRNGAVIAVNLLDGGSGYTSTPSVVIDPRAWILGSRSESESRADVPSRIFFAAMHQGEDLGWVIPHRQPRV